MERVSHTTPCRVLCYLWTICHHRAGGGRQPLSLGAEILCESPVMPCLPRGRRGGWIVGRAAGSHLPTGATRSPRVGFTLRRQPHQLRGRPRSRFRRLLPRGLAGVSFLGNLEVFARVVGRSPLAADSSAQENSSVCAPASWSSCPGPGAAAALPWSSLTAHGPMPGSAVFFSSL